MKIRVDDEKAIFLLSLGLMPVFNTFSMDLQQALQKQNRDSSPVSTGIPLMARDTLNQHHSEGNHTSWVSGQTSPKKESYWQRLIQLLGKGNGACGPQQESKKCEDLEEYDAL